jgi:hypothetical protein
VSQANVDVLAAHYGATTAKATSLPWPHLARLQLQLQPPVAPAAGGDCHPLRRQHALACLAALPQAPSPVAADADSARHDTHVLAIAGWQHDSSAALL